MKFIALALVLLAATSGSSVTLRNSHITFKRALESCTGALGSVTFALNHARIAAHEGVNIDESMTDTNGMFTAQLQSASGGKSASIALDQRERTVAAKNVRVEQNGAVACILPD